MNRYRKGRRWEYEVKERLERAGWNVIRSAGSKGIDLIAYRPGYLPLAVECKVGSKPPQLKQAVDFISWRRCGFRYIVAVKKKGRR